MLSPVLFILAQTPAAPAPGLANTFLFPAVCFAVIIYFGIFRPQQMRTKAQQTLLGSLKTGDKVITSGGIHGIVANIKDGTTLSLKIADNVRIEVDKSAIATVEKDPAPTPAKAA